MSRVIAEFAQFFDDEGDPLVNGWLRFLETNTNNTNKNTYSDVNQTLPNENPLQLDAAGRCPNAFGQGAYRVDLYKNNPVLHTPGELVQSFDPVNAQYTQPGSGGNFADWDAATVYEVSNIVIYNGKYYRSITAGNTNNPPDANPAHWEEIAFLRYWNTNVTYLTDDVVIYSSGLYFSILDANTGNVPTTSPTYWSPVGGGTILLNWEESGTSLRPVNDGYYIGDPTHHVGAMWLDAFSIFPVTPSADPVGDYEVSNKQYTDAAGAARMRWLGMWSPGTYVEFDVVTDDGWTMIANTTTDDRPGPQPVGDAEWVRDQFSPPALSETTYATEVLYVGQRYEFIPAFLVRGIQFYLPASAVGYNMEIWAVVDPGGANERIKNILPGFDIILENTGYWNQFSFGSTYVEAGVTIDVLMVLRVATGGVSFTHQWNYVRANGDPVPGSIYHQSGGNVDQIRVHEQDTSLIDRTLNLDNIGPGSVFTMVTSGYTWEVISASKTGDVYTFIVDPGARAGAATSDFTFTYFGSTSIPYVYNTDLYISDSRISGFLGNEYLPNELTFISNNGYGIDINVQNVTSSANWDVVAVPPENAVGSGGGDADSVGGYTPDEIAILAEDETITGTWTFNNELTINGVSSADYVNTASNETVTGTWTFNNELTINGVSSADYLLAGDSPTVTGDWDFTGALTKNSELVYSTENGPMAGFRNRIINGGLRVWQRSTSLSITSGSGFAADRFSCTASASSSATFSQEDFADGQTDVPGNPDYYYKIDFTTGGLVASATLIQQRIENVKTFSSESCSLSFWARVETTALDIASNLQQAFDNGDASVSNIGVTTHSITTTWQKMVVEDISVPDYSSTITTALGADNWFGLNIWFEAGSNFDSQTNSLGNQSGIVYIAQIQLEPGPVATPFEFRTYGVEELLCYRYFYSLVSSSGTTRLGTGYCNSTVAARGIIGPYVCPIDMRIAAPSISYSGSYGILRLNTQYTIGTLVLTVGKFGRNVAFEASALTGLVAGQGILFRTISGGLSYIYLDAEL